MFGSDGKLTVEKIFKIPFLILGLALTSFYGLPAGAAPTAQIHDDAGRVFSLDSPATRVIALYGAFNEIILALEAGERLAARTAADDDLPELGGLPVIGTHMRPNPELIVAQQPDLVLQLAGRQEVLTQTDALRALGITVLTFNLDSFEDLFRVTEKLGLLLDCLPRAQARVKEWKSRLSALEAEVSAASQGKRVRVFYEVRYPNLLAAGGKGIVQDIITVAGGENVVQEPKKLARYSEEALVALDPEAYIIQTGPMNPCAPPPQARPHYRGLAAVRAGRVLYVEEKRFARPGPRAIDAAEDLARWLKR
jgi:iron complex transport system substrate-binding protein